MTQFKFSLAGRHTGRSSGLNDTKLKTKTNMPNCSRGSPLSKHPLLQHVVLVCTAESARGSVGCKVHADVLRPWVKSLSGLLTTHPSFGGPLVEVVCYSGSQEYHSLLYFVFFKSSFIASSFEIFIIFFSLSLWVGWVLRLFLSFFRSMTVWVM